MFDDGIDKRELLRVKAKTLAAEAKIIRKAEAKAKRVARKRVERGKTESPWTVMALHNHRVTVVRPEARATCLALGLLKGRTLEQMEPRHRPEPEWIKKSRMERVERLMKKYGPPPQTEAARAA